MQLFTNLDSFEFINFLNIAFAFIVGYGISAIIANVKRNKEAKSYKQAIKQSLEDSYVYKNKKIKQKGKKLKKEISKAEQLKQHYLSKQNEAKQALYKIANLSPNEAKEELFEILKEQDKAKISSMLLKQFSNMQYELKKKANFILANAVSRFAGEFTQDNLTTMIELENEEIKGQIIGRDGRNINSMRRIMGVDIIIEKECAIIVSSFNLYRRAIAVSTIKQLLEQKSIHPGKIEETYKRVSKNYEDNLLIDGQKAINKMGIASMHEEIIKLIGRLKYRASYGQNALTHTLEVASLSGLIAEQLGGDILLARRAGLMHDIGKALTDDATSSDHVHLGAEVCKRYNEPEECINAIYAHHDYEEPTSIESASVCAADCLSGGRIGARKQSAQLYMQRVQDMEDICVSKEGVSSAYAINGGREVRVIVNANVLDDEGSKQLSFEIAKEIEAKLKYPGVVKVNIIREIRSVNYAK